MIGVGDKVMLVWACCPQARRYIGWTGIVEAIEPIVVNCPCCFCTHTSNGAHATVTIVSRGYVPIAWLTKIDPDIEAEAREREQLVDA